MIDQRLYMCINQRKTQFFETLQSKFSLISLCIINVFSNIFVIVFHFYFCLSFLFFMYFFFFLLLFLSFQFLFFIYSLKKSLIILQKYILWWKEFSRFLYFYSKDIFIFSFSNTSAFLAKVSFAIHSFFFLQIFIRFSNIVLICSAVLFERDQSVVSVLFLI